MGRQHNFAATTFFILAILIYSASALSGCRPPAPPATIPPDFQLNLDARSAGAQTTVHIYIEIDAQGQARYTRYDTGGTIQLDENGRLVYAPGQVIDKGKFQLSAKEVGALWQTLIDNDFFELTADYRMAIGHSYAAVKARANYKEHQVFNIGMEVPEMRAIIAGVNTLLPVDVKITYGEGFLPTK